ncbi:hypothetical protein LguiB_031699 [Lonicera macranthoides]
MAFLLLTHVLFLNHLIDSNSIFAVRFSDFLCLAFLENADVLHIMALVEFLFFYSTYWKHSQLRICSLVFLETVSCDRGFKRQRVVSSNWKT